MSLEHRSEQRRVAKVSLILRIAAFVTARPLTWRRTTSDMNERRNVVAGRQRPVISHCGIIRSNSGIVEDKLTDAGKRASRQLLFEPGRVGHRPFVANAAHELQTPLAGLKTQAEHARRATDPAMRDHALERIAISVDRTSRLVRQLLELATQEAREAESARSFVRVDQVLPEIQAEHGHSAEGSGQTVRISCPQGPIEFAIDREALLLALGNLVENALQHGEGPVSIECEADGDLRLLVVDGGRGVAKGEQDRVRRRFERGRGAAGGTGLGLSIVEAAIQPAGGVLEFSQRGGAFAAILRFPPATFHFGKAES